MAKDKEIDLSQPITLTAGDLLQLFTKMQEQQLQASTAQTEAISQLSPRYVSPEQKQFTEQAKEQQRNIEIFKLKNKKRQQRLCEHEQGQTGNRRSGEGAFNLLKLPTGEIIGVCTYCQMVISSVNPDHQKFFRKAGGTAAESGQLTQYIVDPIKAQLARLGPDERARVILSREKYMSTAAAVADLEDEVI
jgi:hypothetical protein